MAGYGVAYLIRVEGICPTGYSREEFIAPMQFSSEESKSWLKQATELTSPWLKRKYFAERVNFQTVEIARTELSDLQLDNLIGLSELSDMIDFLEKSILARM